MHRRFADPSYQNSEHYPIIHRIPETDLERTVCSGRLSPYQARSDHIRYYLHRYHDITHDPNPITSDTDTSYEQPRCPNVECGCHIRAPAPARARASKRGHHLIFTDGNAYCKSLQHKMLLCTYRIMPSLREQFCNFLMRKIRRFDE